MSDINTTTQKAETNIEVAVRFKFNEDTARGLPAYADTLFIPHDQYGKLSGEELAALQSERYESWADRILNPPPPPPPPEQPDLVEAAHTFIATVTQAFTEYQTILDAGK